MARDRADACHQPRFHDRADHAGQERTLKAGTAYSFVISDRADVHDFHLSGPGFNRVLTSLEFTGTKSLVPRPKEGTTYRFACDPYSGIMHGSFKIS